LSVVTSPDAAWTSISATFPASAVRSFGCFVVESAVVSRFDSTKYA
jgi:hypothetical protein